MIVTSNAQFRPVNEDPRPWTTEESVVRFLNAQFYARLAVLGIVPPIGPDGPQAPR